MSCHPIIFDAVGMVEQTMKNPYTMVGKQLCGTHVINVWEAISNYVTEQMCKGNAVRIPGLVSFTYKVNTLEISQSKVIVNKIPHMIPAGDLVMKCSLKVNKPAYNLTIPETPLNISVISRMVGLSRELVQAAMDEVIQAFSRSLLSNPMVEFIFPNIGRIVSTCREMDSVFCKDFLDCLGFAEEFIQDKSCSIR